MTASWRRIVAFRRAKIFRIASPPLRRSPGALPKLNASGRALRASTNEAYCPTLRALGSTQLPDGVNAVYEIVIDGLDLAAVEAATAAGVRAACRPGIARISAGNYGGKLGQYQVHLHRVLGVGADA